MARHSRSALQLLLWTRLTSSPRTSRPQKKDVPRLYTWSIRRRMPYNHLPITNTQPLTPNHHLIHTERSLKTIQVYHTVSPTMLDNTMLAPGPAGTSMIGESNIQAAARRGLEKQRRRERKLQTGRQTGDTSEEGVHSEATTLAPQNAEAWESGVGHGGESEQRISRDEELGSQGHQGESPRVSGKGVGKIRSVWGRIQKRG